MDFGVATVAAITALCYVGGLAGKASSLNDKWIPVLCGCMGLALGVAAMYIGVPDFPADDVITAAAVGAVSGLASTGVNQAVRQLTK